MTDEPHVSAQAGLSAMVITVSDGVAAGARDDRSGDMLEERLSSLGFRVERAVVPDEPEQIGRLAAAAVDRGVRLVVTTGGTGVGPRDRTPEGIQPIIDYLVPGYGEAMRAEGRRHTPMASLSRSFAAVRGQTLILCLPGSPRGVSESLDAVDEILVHTLETLAGHTAHL